MRLLNKVALVTGSASGIGRATALALAAEGADIVVADVKPESEVRGTVVAVEGLGRRALPVRVDVSNDRQVQEMVEQIVATLGRLDILVNDAGTTTRVAFRDLDLLTEEIWDRTYAVNVKGTFFCSRTAAKAMLKQGGGCIVNVASIAGVRPMGSSIAYCASKAAVISLTRTLAVTLAPEIRVNAVAPGYIATGWNTSEAEARQRVSDAVPLKRLGSPEDVAEVIVGLAANSSYVTGQVILVDGGWML